MQKKAICSLLSLLFLCTSFVSCSETPGSTEETSANVTPVSETQPETEEDVNYVEKFQSDYMSVDLGGYSFRILDRGSGDWKTFDVYAEEMTGETINDAVYNRNSILENTINIKIIEVPSANDDVKNDLKKSIASATDDYDTATTGLEGITSMVQMNYYLDMRSIGTMHFDNVWWDQAMYNETSIANKTYFMTGDISVMDNYGTWCYLFNKQLIKNLNLENPYELVDSGRWTIDKHNEMAESAQSDTDGDGKWTDADTYGFVTEPYNNLALWTCFGFKIADRDENDLPYYTYNGEAEVTALAKIIDTQYSSFTNMGTDSTVTGGGSFEPNTRENQFASGKALFYYAGFRNVTLFRESDTDFGIIPAPKYNEEQSQYYSSYSAPNCTAYVIPVTVQNPEQVGTVMELMAELGLYTLTPAYYDITLIGKSTRDVESEAMIDLIFKTRNYDLGVILNLGNVSSTIQNARDSGTIASNLEKITKPANKLLDKFISGIGG